jgi:hypothetical protein
VIKKNKPLNKNTKILEFFFDQKDNNNNNNNIPKTNTKDIFDPKNMEYTTPPKAISQILVTDSQVIVPSSAPSSHPSLYIVSLSFSTIQSSVVDSNASTQTSNILETFELLTTLPMFPILSEKNSS